MKYFIELSSRVINKLHIIEIVKKPNKYCIHMNNIMTNKTLFSNGNQSTEYNVIEICKKYHKEDYDTITKVILNHKIYF
jgi:hypothetical protein